MIEQVLSYVDFGMMLLIWLVQVVIYPSFSYYSSLNLQNWHSKYTLRITFFVLPLMFMQLLGHSWLLWSTPSFYNWLIFISIVIAWLVTFLIEVPLHSKISRGENSDGSVKLLINWNWPRTIAWSLVFIIHIILV